MQCFPKDMLKSLRLRLTGFLRFSFCHFLSFYLSKSNIIQHETVARDGFVRGVTRDVIIPQQSFSDCFLSRGAM